jgi:hypothetical protein
MLLREMQAFQACWMDLKDDYPTSRKDHTLIAQAMEQLVDQYQKPKDIQEPLPDYLQPLFRRLALAYFQGYEPREAIDIQETGLSDSINPRAVSQHQVIAAAVNKVQWLAQRARHDQQEGRQAKGKSLSEMDTLIIEILKPWKSEDDF